MLHSFLKIENQKENVLLYICIRKNKKIFPFSIGDFVHIHIMKMQKDFSLRNFMFL